MNRNIFYTEVSDNVKNALTNRKHYYGGTFRDTDAHAWLNRKMAYVEAFASNPNANRKASLTVRNLGGVGEKNALYSNTPGYGLYQPKPHIISVKVSNEGDYGSLKKCEVAFAVYNLNDLDTMQAFFDIGGDISLSYGWTNGSAGAGPTGKFAGKIYNFSYNVNALGGFDCISYGIGEGISILATDAKASVQSQNNKSTIIDTAAILDNNLIGIIRQMCHDLTTSGKLQPNSIDEITTDGNGYVTSGTGIGIIKLPSNPATDVLFPSNYFISLEGIVNVINTRILANSNLTDKFKQQNSALNYLSSITGYSSTNWQGTPYSIPNPVDVFDNTLSSTDLQRIDILAKIRLVCFEDVTRGILPAQIEDLVSGNPLEVLFPGYGTYGTMSFFNTGKSSDSFKTGDISKIMINVNWLESMFNVLGNQTQDYQKSADKTFSQFFKNIFNSILNNSGNRFKLTLVSNPKDDNQILIADVNYIDSKVNAYELTAVNANSICRAMSLQSKIPSEFATAAMVGSANTMTTQRGDMRILTGGNVKPVTKVDIVNLREDLKKAKGMLISQLPTPTNVSSLQSALRNVYQYIRGVGNKQVSLGQSSPFETIPFPINFSATLDGIEGFIFGNVITTNYLPSVYRKNKIAFTIIKVEHTISNNDWTTQLSTVCRLMPDDATTEVAVTNGPITVPAVNSTGWSSSNQNVPGSGT